MPISILVVERNFLGAELLSSALKRCQNNFDVLGHATTFADAVRKLEDLRPRIVLISVRLPDDSATGYKLMSYIRDHWPKMLPIALLSEPPQAQVLDAFRSGARGVISGDQSFRVLAKCIRKVHEGEIWASADQIGLVFETLNNSSNLVMARAAQGFLAELTPREKDVAALVMEGFRNAEIGAKLRVSEHTVRNYIMKIYDKLGVSNRVQLTRQYIGSLEKGNRPAPRGLVEA